MILKLIELIDDVEKALEAGCKFSALALALTFPDICGKAEYPQQTNSRIRYINWYDEHISPFEKSQEPQMPYLNGEVVNSLRNSFLHQGTPNIDVGQFKNKIDKFELIIETKKPFGIYCDGEEINNDGIKTYSVNVQRLCNILCSTARGYYNDNKEKFDFINCTIKDWDFEVKQMHE
jgi:hypothetical protein